MSWVRVIFRTASPCLWTSASIMPISSTRSSKWLNDASGSLPRHDSRLAVATAVQPPARTASKPHAIDVAAKVGRHLAGVVGEHHRVLVDVDQQQVVHQPLEAQLLGTIERHAHGWHAIDLLRQE